MKPVVVAIVLPAALLGAGCGGGSKEESPPPTGPVVKTISISETEYKLEPSTVKLDKQGIYVFKATNGGGVTHALELEGNGVEAKTGNIAPGSSAELRVAVTKAGEYELYCPIDGHKGRGMLAKVTFGSSGAGGGTTTTTATTPADRGYSY